MTGLLGRIAEGGDGGGPAVAATGVSLAEIARRLEAGEALDRLGLGPADLVAALARLGLSEASSEGLPLVRGKPLRAKLQRSLAEPALAAILPDVARPVRLALAAGLLQIHDFWEASHEAAQEADDRGESRFSPYWHGIAHRREPDYGNAAYWFRRVGRHPLYPALGAAATALVEAEGTDADRRSLPVDRSGSWDPDAFSNLHRACRNDGPSSGLARRLQRLELAMLLDATAAEAGLT
jgi:hypothetical protein